MVTARMGEWKSLSGYVRLASLSLGSVSVPFVTSSFTSSERHEPVPPGRRKERRVTWETWGTVRGARQGTDDWRGLVSLCRPRFRPFPLLSPSVPRHLVTSGGRSEGTEWVNAGRRISDEMRNGRGKGRDSSLIARPFPRPGSRAERRENGRAGSTMGERGEWDWRLK